MIVDDPLIDLLPVDHPATFDRLPRGERRWRLRLYLACWAMGCPADLSWAMALEDNPIHVTESLAILAGIPDAAIRSAVRNRMASADRPNVGTAVEEAASARALAHRGRASTGMAEVPAMTETRSQASTPAETADEHWDPLLRESRARGQPPSRITLLVPHPRPDGRRS